MASWNLKWFQSYNSRDRRLALLREVAWDLLALQEVTPEVFAWFEEQSLGDSSAYPGAVSGAFASALFARGGLKLSRPTLLARLPNPALGIAATVTGSTVAFEVCSWHAPNAAKPNDPQVKRRAYMAFNEWVCARSLPLIVGTDANHGARWIRADDFPGSAFRLPEFAHDAWWEENCFWGPTPDHDMRDVWMDHLCDNPELVSRIRAERPEGPSAISYVRGHANPFPDRFDYILASPDFRARSVEYEYTKAREAHSDHALVRAELELEGKLDC